MSKTQGVELLNGSNNFVKDNSIKSILEVLLGKLEHILDIDRVELLNGSNNFVKDNSIKSILEFLLGKLEHILDIDRKSSMSTIL